MSVAPELTIIVPVYKAEPYLNDCLDSIRAQTFSDYEVILVDDGSPDNSGAICDHYALNDSRFRVIHKANGGASTARQAGLKAAKGRYIGWVDADDKITPDMYQTLYNLITGYNADIAECNMVTVTGDRRISSPAETSIISGSGNFILKQFFTARMRPSFCTKLYRAGLFDHIIFPERQIHVDFYVNVQLALKPLVYVRTSKPMYIYCVRENSNITTFDSRAFREAFYKYDYTRNLACCSDDLLARKYLNKDAINRLMWRYLEVSLNADLKNQNVYNKILKKRLGTDLYRYLFLSRLPLKTRVSYFLILSNLKSIQQFLHRHLGIRGSLLHEAIERT